MSNEQWHSRWRQGRIGFHLSEVNPLLIRHLAVLPPVEARPRILVPLCGKSLDLIELQTRGFDIFGVELSELAVAAFFEEQGLLPSIERMGAFVSYRCEGLEILCGDFFDLDRDFAGDLAGAYDRAALVALSGGDRKRYVERLARLLPPESSVLLISIEYEQSERKGPPFSIPEGELRQLFDAFFEIDRLQRDDLSPEDVAFRELSRLSEVTYRLLRR